MKKFENFINDDNRDNRTLEQLPKHNPVVNLEAKKWVDELFNKNINILLKISGLQDVENTTELLSDDTQLEEIKKKAINYYIDNPDKIGNEDENSIVSPSKMQNVIPKTNNVGGSLHSNSPRIGESKLNFDTELEINSDEMNLFNTEESLMDLIRNNRILLGNKVIRYNNKDKETKQTLDIYFEIDEVDPIEETLAYLTHSDTKPSSIVYLGELGKKFDLSNFTNIESLIEIANSYSEAFQFDSIDEKTEQDLVEKAENVFQGWNTKTMRNIGEVSEQSSQLLEIPNGRFELLTIELINNDYKLVMDVAKSVSNYIVVFISKVEIDGKHFLEFEGLMPNSTYICDIKYDYEGWKELLSNLFEKL